MNLKTSGGKLYDFWAAKSVYTTGMKHRLNIVLKHIRKRRPRGRVLDLGFGAGYSLKKLVDGGYETFGVDISKKNVELRHKEFGNRVVLKHGSATDIPFESNFFTCVVAGELLEHLNDANLNKALREIYRVLAPNGLFIATTPNKQDLNETTTMCPFCKRIFSVDGHKQSFSLNELRALLSKHQFSIVYGTEIDYPVGDIPTISYLIYKKIWRLKKNGLLVIGKKIAIKLLAKKLEITGRAVVA